jgi:hypothetical protein
LYADKAHEGMKSFPANFLKSTPQFFFREASTFVFRETAAKFHGAALFRHLPAEREPLKVFRGFWPEIGRKD